MSNINLYQNEQLSKEAIREGLFDKGLLVGTIIFVIFLAGFGGMKMYLRSLDSQIAAAKEEELASRNSLNKEDVNLVASFQQRMDMLASGKAAFAKNNPISVFQNVQNAMIGGVVASDINVKDKTVGVAFLADNFEVLAKQILSFKKSGVFKDVQMKNSVLDEKGKVKAELTMTLASN